MSQITGRSTHSFVSPFWKTLPPQITRGSEEELGFLSDLVDSISSIPVPSGSTKDDVTLVMKLIGDAVSKAWDAHTSSPRVCARLKGWWDATCAAAWKNYKSSGGSKEEWFTFRNVARSAKRKFFDDKIEEISHTKLRPWDLMSWTKPRKQDAVEAILHKGSPCLTTEDTWNAFQDTFNAAHSRDAYPGRLGPALNPKPKREWAPFFGKEITEALTGCSGQSAPGPDHLTWSHIKIFVLDETF